MLDNFFIHTYLDGIAHNLELVNIVVLKPGNQILFSIVSTGYDSVNCFGSKVLSIFSRIWVRHCIKFFSESIEVALFQVNRESDFLICFWGSRYYQLMDLMTNLPSHPVGAPALPWMAW